MGIFRCMKLAVMIAAMSMASIASANNFSVLPHDAWVKGYILVSPRDGLSPEEFNNIVVEQGGATVDKLQNLNIFIVSVPTNAEQAVAFALSHNSKIKFAEVDQLVLPAF